MRISDGSSDVCSSDLSVPAGSHPHDVAPDPAPGAPVWYTAQHQGALGRLDPQTGKTLHIPLGDGSAPHGVIVGPDGAPWITDGRPNAIVRVDPQPHPVQRYPLPGDPRHAHLPTATFAGTGALLFTSTTGSYRPLDHPPTTAAVWADP